MLAPWGEQDMESGTLSHDAHFLALQSVSHGVGVRSEARGSNAESLRSLPLPSVSSGGGAVPSGLRGAAVLAAASRGGAAGRAVGPRSPLSGSGPLAQCKQYQGVRDEWGRIGGGKMGFMVIVWELFPLSPLLPSPFPSPPQTGPIQPRSRVLRERF